MIQGPKCHDNGIKGYGNADGRVMLLGISPGSSETRIGRPMVGQSGVLIDNILTACGWSRDKIYATNLVCFECKTPTFEQIMECWPRLQAEVALVKPSLIVTLGAQVGEMFFSSRKFGNVRGAIDYYEPFGCHVLPTYHPAAILYGGGEFVTGDIIRDFQKIREFFDYPPRPDVSFEVVSTLERAQEIMQSLPTDRFVALDVETLIDKDEDTTTAVDGTLICFAISDGDNTYWFPGHLATHVTWRQDVQWTFHNGPFDTVELHEATGVWLPIVHDTQYMSYALDERSGKHKLKVNARETEACGFYEEHLTAKKWNDKARDTAWIQVYNSKDAAYTARIAQRYMRRLRSDNMLPVYNKTIQAANIYRHMQATGVPINRERYYARLQEWVPMRDSKAKALQAKVGELGGNPNINLASPKQLSAFLYGTLRLPGGPSTAANIIEELAFEHPFINDLLDLRHLDKALDNYVVGAYDDLKKDGRIHPNPMLHGQVSGRVSYSPYAINTLPRETSDNPYLAQIRSLFTAPDDDHVMLIVDLSQAEVWTAAYYSEDPQMLADLRTGDFHRTAGSWIFGIPKAALTDEQRSDAKRTTFGMFYGIGDYKLARQTGRSVIEAQAYKQAWYLRYPGYLRYIDECMKEARVTGELVTIEGRKRRFPMVLDDSIKNKVINYKIQTTAHSVLLEAIIEGYDMVRAMHAYPILDIHDAWAIIARKNNVQEVAARVVDLMQKRRFSAIQIPAEAKVGFSLGEVEKIKL